MKHTFGVLLAAALLMGGAAKSSAATEIEVSFEKVKWMGVRFGLPCDPEKAGECNMRMKLGLTNVGPSGKGRVETDVVSGRRFVTANIRSASYDYQGDGRVDQQVERPELRTVTLGTFTLPASAVELERDTRVTVSNATVEPNGNFRIYLD